MNLNELIYNENSLLMKMRMDNYFDEHDYELIKTMINEVSLDCKNCLKIDFDSDEECAVYMMEHNALAGMLEKTNSEINFSGEVDIMGDVMDITFHIDV